LFVVEKIKSKELGKESLAVRPRTMTRRLKEKSGGVKAATEGAEPEISICIQPIESESDEERVPSSVGRRGGRALVTRRAPVVASCIENSLQPPWQVLDIGQ
jgi:hypothetical protein